MRIRIKLFSLFREIFNSSEIEIQVDKDSVTIEELKDVLARINPRMREISNDFEPIIMVNGAVADVHAKISEGDEVALIPPVSGGSKHIVAKFFTNDSDVSADSMIRDALAKLGGEGIGAIAIFVGVVKDVVDGYRVKELVYDSYEPYATRALERIAMEESLKEGVKAVEIMHRVGVAKPGEKTLFILVASKNRKEAIETLTRVLERVKHEVPIFKLERREDGDYYIIGDDKRIRSSNEVF